MIDLLDVDLLIWIPIFTIAFMIPWLCYLDIKYREIPYIFWLPLIIINAPITAYLYFTGIYPIYSLAFSLIMVGIFWYLMVKKFIHGADMIFLSIISMFFIVNPYPLPHGIMQIPFYFYLLATMFFTAVILLLYNYRKGFRCSALMMMSQFDRGVPFILPISAAFIITVVFG